MKGEVPRPEQEGRRHRGRRTPAEEAAEGNPKEQKERRKAMAGTAGAAVRRSGVGGRHEQLGPSGAGHIA